MHMSIQRASFLAGFLLAALLEAPLTSPAAAAEAYLCDDNRLVYVEVEDLERMIRVDPCIARYHGVDLQRDASDSDQLVRFSEPLGVSGAPASPARVAATEPAPAPAPTISPLRATTSSTAARRKAVAAHGRGEARQPVQAAPGTDFHNVRVINATEEAERWFRLAR